MAALFVLSAINRRQCRRVDPRRLFRRRTPAVILPLLRLSKNGIFLISKGILVAGNWIIMFLVDYQKLKTRRNEGKQEPPHVQGVLGIAQSTIGRVSYSFLCFRR